MERLTKKNGGVVNWYYTPVMMRKDFLVEADYMLDPFALGKSWFLTRAETKKALEVMAE